MNETVSTVLQEIRAGDGVGLAAVGKQFPGRDGRSVNPATVYRWATSGAKSAGGHKIKLEHIRLGSKILTSWAAVERFCQALSINPADEPQARTPAQRNRASESAARKLAQLGA